MLIDVCLGSSLLQQSIQWLGLSLIATLIYLSGLPLALSCVLLAVLLGLHCWFNYFIPTRRIAALWQGDSQSWYWQQQGKRFSGRLIKTTDIGLAIHLVFVAESQQHTCTNVVIWRDQISHNQWRRLKVVHFLNDSQQNWF